MGLSKVTNTQEILDRCAELASAAFPETGGGCTARDAAIYLAHTEQGESLRALAAATGTHPSTVMRAVRRVEERRDDPLVDSMIADLETRSVGRCGEGSGGVPSLANGNLAADPAARQPAQPKAASKGLAPAELEREARRFLRRLCEPGSFLLVTPDATKGGVFCKANDYRKPIAMLPVNVAVAFLREGWIRVFRRGAASIRYRVADDGRSYLKRLLAADALKRQPASGFAEASSPFLAQHQLPGQRAVVDPATGESRAIKVNLGEEPLGWLSRRKGADGRPFLSPGEIEAGETILEATLRAGIAHAHPHKMRRSFAMSFLESGGLPDDLRVLMGHSSQHILRTYVAQREQERALKAHEEHDPADRVLRR